MYGQVDDLHQVGAGHLSVRLAATIGIEKAHIFCIVPILDSFSMCASHMLVFFVAKGQYLLRGYR
jgi:hypothetical protein